MKIADKTWKVHCPLINGEMERLTCEDVSTAAEGMQPERFAPKEIREIDSWKEKCMECPKHPE